MNISYLIIGIIFLGLAYWFFKFIKIPVWSKKDEEDARNDGSSDDLIWTFKFDYKLRRLKNLFGRIVLVVIGFLFIWIAFKKSTKPDFLWEYIMK